MRAGAGSQRSRETLAPGSTGCHVPHCATLTHSSHVEVAACSQRVGAHVYLGGTSGATCATDPGLADAVTAARGSLTRAS